MYPPNDFGSHWRLKRQNVPVRVFDSVAFALSSLFEMHCHATKRQLCRKSLHVPVSFFVKWKEKIFSAQPQAICVSIGTNFTESIHTVFLSGQAKTYNLKYASWRCSFVSNYGSFSHLGTDEYFLLQHCMFGTCWKTHTTTSHKIDAISNDVRGLVSNHNFSEISNSHRKSSYTSEMKSRFHIWHEGAINCQ